MLPYLDRECLRTWRIIPNPLTRKRVSESTPTQKNVTNTNQTIIRHFILNTPTLHNPNIDQPSPTIHSRIYDFFSDYHFYHTPAMCSIASEPNQFFQPAHLDHKSGLSD
ncbi:protein of unknown function [Burkholderia multivorans]